MTSDDRLRIRPAAAGDETEIADMANALNAALGYGSDAYSARQFLDAGFPGRAPFDVLIAERDGFAVGYALFQPIFNTDLMGPGLFMNDLFVKPDARGRGIARRLIAEVAGIARSRGCVSVWWVVLHNNKAARRLYARLGAEDEHARLNALTGPAFERLAARAGTNSSHSAGG